jgi:hypothetical protein
MTEIDRKIQDGASTKTESENGKALPAPEEDPRMCIDAEIGAIPAGALNASNDC